LLFTLDQAQEKGSRVVDFLGCGDANDVLVCMRDKSMEELFSVFSDYEPLPGGLLYEDISQSGWCPVVDGVVIPRQIYNAFEQGELDIHPLLLGSVTDEGTLFQSIAFGTPIADEVEYEQALERIFPDHTAEILAEYPVSEYDTPRAALDELTGDWAFVCPARRAARSLSSAGVTVYLYTFDQEPFEPLIPDLGVFHSSEIPFVFGNNFFLNKVSEEGAPISEAMMRYWTRFATTGDPNGGDDVFWPKYEESSDQHIVLHQPIETGSNLKKDKCDFWDGVFDDIHQ
jgi:para-nitrobenzyl esterase